jgi:hypothetical protein
MSIRPERILPYLIGGNSEKLQVSIPPWGVAGMPVPCATIEDNPPLNFFQDFPIR